MLEPLVSVLMTVYNRESYITEAVESVLKSTYKNFELIINDDKSTDNSFAIAKEYERIDSRVHVFQNQANLKDYPNRNKTASYAKGKYIKFLDSDDTIYPNGLSYCVDAMEANPLAGMGILFFQKNITSSEVVLWTPKEAIQHHFYERGFLNVGPSGTIFRRDVFEKFGGFDTRFGVASDSFFNLRLASEFPVVLLPEVFFFYRVHDGQEIKDEKGYLLNNHLYLKELVTNTVLPLTGKELSLLKARIEKSFSKEILRFLIKSKDLSNFFSILKKGGYTLPQMVKNLI